MVLSCHVFKVPMGSWNTLINRLEDISNKGKYKIRINYPDTREFEILLVRIPNLEGRTRYYIVYYPEPFEYPDYQTGEIVRAYKRESTYIIPVSIEEFGLIFLCGGNIVKTKMIIEEIAGSQAGFHITLFTFPITASEIEFLVKQYGFKISYAKLTKPDINKVDAVAIWGSSLEQAEFYRQLREISRNPDKEIRLIDKSDYRGGRIGITRMHDKTNTLVIRIWKKLEPDDISRYIVNRIISPILEQRKKIY